MSSNQVADHLLVSNDTIMKWVRRFNDEGYHRLEDLSRSGREPIIDYDDLKKTLESSPQDFDYLYQAWFPRLVYQYLYDYQDQTDMYGHICHKLIELSNHQNTRKQQMLINFE